LTGGGRSASRVLAVVALACIAWVVWPAARRAVLRPEASPAMRGRAVADDLGCFACHGPEGRGGVSNPGSRRETIPGFTGSTLMMYVHDDAEIAQYIRDGRPDRLADDPDYRAEIEAQAVRMPAYRGLLREGDLEALVAYVRAVSGMVEPRDESARRGLEVAREAGCFGCHGALGMGGRANPGSLKGYVPGFWGEDYRELVRDEGELREWIRNGRLARIDEHWIGGWFSRRQLLQMPAYERFLDDRQIDDLIALMRWIQSGGPQREPLS
jgi:mono/diheme cytochrome c family protein